MPTASDVRAVLQDARRTRYVVYWDRFTPAQWQTKQDEYQAELAREKELEPAPWTA